jgi:hypothetical protein
MKSCKQKIGLTLIETLLVIAIIAILAAVVVAMAARIDNQRKVQLTKNTLALIDAALGQFEDFGYEYKIYASAGTTERDFFRSLDFPIDCTGLLYTGTNNLRSALGRALGSASGTTLIEILPSALQQDERFSGSEVLYFFLNKIPECRKTLDKIDGKLITNLGKDGNPLEIRIRIGGDSTYPLFRFIDPWGTTLRYDYYDETKTNYDDRRKSERTFPVVTSAGPDKTFDTGDDIKSRD